MPIKKKIIKGESWTIIDETDNESESENSTNKNKKTKVTDKSESDIESIDEYESEKENEIEEKLDAITVKDLIKILKKQDGKRKIYLGKDHLNIGKNAKYKSIKIKKDYEGIDDMKSLLGEEYYKFDKIDLEKFYDKNRELWNDTCDPKQNSYTLDELFSTFITSGKIESDSSFGIRTIIEEGPSSYTTKKELKNGYKFSKKYLTKEGKKKFKKRIEEYGKKKNK